MVRSGRSESPDSQRAPAGVVSPCIRMKPDDEDACYGLLLTIRRDLGIEIIISLALLVSVQLYC